MKLATNILGQSRSAFCTRGGCTHSFKRQRHEQQKVIPYPSGGSQNWRRLCIYVSQRKQTGLGKDSTAFLKKKDTLPVPSHAGFTYPGLSQVVRIQKEEQESTDESSGKKGFKAKLMKARDEVKRLKKELTGTRSRLRARRPWSEKGH